MRLLTVVTLTAAFLGLSPSTLAQSKASSNQKAGNCSVNIAGNGNTASLVCHGIDATLAKQMQAILHGTLRNESTAKDISQKLDQIVDYMNVEATPPDVGLRFVYAKSPALLIVNQSGVVARDIKWTVELWDMDAPNQNSPLPIPTTAFDWIQPHANGGPENLFASPAVAHLLTSNTRLVGTAAISCATCTAVHLYVVYITFGQGGWFSEVDNPQSNWAVWPHDNQTPQGRVAFFNDLIATIPLEKRVPIVDIQISHPKPSND